MNTVIGKLTSSQRIEIFKAVLDVRIMLTQPKYRKLLEGIHSLKSAGKGIAISKRVNVTVDGTLARASIYGVKLDYGEPIVFPADPMEMATVKEVVYQTVRELRRGTAFRKDTLIVEACIHEGTLKFLIDAV